MSRPNWRKGKAPEQKSENSQTSSPSQPVGQSTELVRSFPTPQRSPSFNETFVPSANPKDSTSVVFFDVCLELSKVGAEVWPEDDFLISEHEKLSTVRQESKHEEGFKLARMFHAEFVNKYSDIIAKKPEFFFEQTLNFTKLKTHERYVSSSEDTREKVWELLRSLVQYGGMIDMYSKCPQAMLDSISGVAGGIISKMKNGELDMNNLNPVSLGQMMMSQMSTDDLEGFGKAIMEGGNMDSMMSIMQSTMGNGGIPGMPDMSSIMSMLGSQQ